MNGGTVLAQRVKLTPELVEAFEAKG